MSNLYWILSFIPCHHKSHFRLKVGRSKQEIEDVLPKNVTKFSFKLLQKATNNFSTWMGSGRFTSYYKGTLEDGTVVAIEVHKHGKRDWDWNWNKDLDFVSLVKMMSRIRHRNVVELIGCCVEDHLRIIVYEFVGENNLGQFLFKSNAKGAELSWPRRVSICLGVARGLEYLHQGIKPCVVHCDITPGNVLLDEEFNPKIAEFEIAHLIDNDFPHYRASVAGTLGYIAPEYWSTGELTEKADVYGFGILLLEIITGKNIVQFLRDNDTGTTLVDWVWELRESGRLMDIVDPTLAEFPKDEVIRFIDVALYSVQESSDLRPSMSEVFLMLLGGYDFNKMILQKPERSCWLGIIEVNNPVHDQISGEIEITPARSNAVSPMYVYERPEESTSARESLKRTLSDMIRGDEIESESDPDTVSGEEELLQMSHDLETELYGSIGPKSTVAVSELGPIDDTVVEPEMMSASSEANVLMKNDALEAAEQLKTSHDVQAEVYTSTKLENISGAVTVFGPSLETLVNPEMMMTMSTQTHIFSHNEGVEGFSFQAHSRQRNMVISLPKVDLARPIRCTVDKILEAFRDGESRRICLYGRGGSGKTTVLKTLFHHSATKHFFDQIIFVTVPRLAHQKTIQNVIIQQLSLNVQDSNAEDEIAALIRHALKCRNVLLLLDDVWEIINLHEVGIPTPSPKNSCWLVLATRSWDISHVMGDREIEMEVLSTVEAWDYFHNQVGSIVDSPEIEPFARAISDRCHGLPLMISAVGSALRLESSVLEWKLALQRFQFSDTGNLFSWSPQIKYCYDRLKAHDVKTCFLYCALFAREKEIDISVLVDCFVNERLLGGTKLAAYKKGLDIVGHLVNSALLEVNDNGLMVKMHNIVSDSALAILSDIEGYNVLVKSYLSPSLVSKTEDVQSSEGSCSTTKMVDRQDSSLFSPNIHKYLTGIGSQLKEPPSLEEWEQATMIFLMDTGLSSLPRKPNCANLEALCLQRNNLRIIPTSFFDSMCTLRILNLSKTRIKSLPDSFAELKNLQVLVLRDCERFIMLPPSIGGLKSLQVLDLQGTELSHLPDTVGELASLKQLRVSFYRSINHREYKKLPAKLILDGTFTSPELRELGIFVYPEDPRWSLSVLDVIKEVKNLTLFILYFPFPKVEHLKYFLDGNQSWISRILGKFNFIVGRDFKHIVSQISNDAELMYSEEERCLRFVNGENTPDAVLEILARVTAFYLDHHLCVRDFSEFGIYRMLDLKVCIIRDCPELLTVVDTKEHQNLVLPSLEYLSINQLWNLKGICVGHVLMGSFGKLRYLSVHGCPKLRYVLTCSMLEMLLTLEELEIEDCESMECVVIEDAKVLGGDAVDKFVGTTADTDGQIIADFPVLRSLKVLKLHYLPELCSIWKGCWPSLEYISFYDCPKLKNLHMEANDAMSIKEITTDKEWWDMLQWDDSVVSRRLHEHVTQIHIDGL